MGTAQPPWPLHEFLPAQPLSPVEQPPMPLQAFIPLQLWCAVVAQPPFPLQEFLPAQPWSPLLQPPMPLQEFMPLQACFSVAVAWDASFSLSLLQPAANGAPATSAATAATINAFLSLRPMVPLRIGRNGRGEGGRDAKPRPNGGRLRKPRPSRTGQFREYGHRRRRAPWPKGARMLSAPPMEELR